jgi:hypothetical protein
MHYSANSWSGEKSKAAACGADPLGSVARWSSKGGLQTCPSYSAESGSTRTVSSAGAFEPEWWVRLLGLRTAALNQPACIQ